MSRLAGMGLTTTCTRDKNTPEWRFFNQKFQMITEVVNGPTGSYYTAMRGLPGTNVEGHRRRLQSDETCGLSMADYCRIIYSGGTCKLLKPTKYASVAYEVAYRYYNKLATHKQQGLWTPPDEDILAIQDGCKQLYDDLKFYIGEDDIRGKSDIGGMFFNFILSNVTQDNSMRDEHGRAVANEMHMDDVVDENDVVEGSGEGWR